jgi:hypothetical protein
MIQVRVTANVEDWRQPPETAVSGVSTIDEIAPGMIRVRYFGNHFNDDGKLGRVVVDDQIWSEQEWLCAMQAALVAWSSMQPARQREKLQLVAGMH